MAEGGGLDGRNAVVLSYWHDWDDDELETLEKAIIALISLFVLAVIVIIVLSIVIFVQRKRIAYGAIESYAVYTEVQAPVNNAETVRTEVGMPMPTVEVPILPPETVKL